MKSDKIYLNTINKGDKRVRVQRRQKTLEDVKITLEFGALQFNIELDDGFFGHLADVYSEKHNHSSFEVQIIKQGNGKLYIGQTKIALQAGDCVIIGEGIYHSFYGTSPDFVRIDFRFRFSVPKDISDYTTNSDIQNIRDAFTEKFTYRVFPHRPVLLNMIHEIMIEMTNKPLCYYSSIRYLFSLLIIAIVREISPIAESESDMPYKVMDEKRDHLIEKFFDNYDLNLSADELARLLNVSQRQLNRIMQNTYHTTFKQKLLDIRIEVAKELLKNSDLKIYEIAEKVGYMSAKSFSIIFKKKTGLTSQSFRIKP